MLYHAHACSEKTKSRGVRISISHATVDAMQQLGRIMSQLEGTEAAMVAASGMAAITTSLLAFLKSGDHVLVQRELYGGTYSFVKHNLLDLGIQHTEIDVRDPSSWDALVTAQTKASLASNSRCRLCTYNLSTADALWRMFQSPGSIMKQGRCAGGLC